MTNTNLDATCLASDLARAATVVVGAASGAMAGKGAAQKGTPVCLYLMAEADTGLDWLRVACAGEGLVLSTFIAAAVKCPGEAYPLAATLFELMSVQDDDTRVALSVTGERTSARLHVAAGRTRSNLRVENPALFPKLRDVLPDDTPSVDGPITTSIRIGSFELEDAISGVQFACLSSDLKGNPAMTGLHAMYHPASRTLELVGAEPVRMARQTVVCLEGSGASDPAEAAKGWIIPPTTAIALRNLCSAAGKGAVVTLQFTHGGAGLIAWVKTYRLDSVLIGAEYPRLPLMILDQPTSAVFETAEMVKALRVAGVVAEEERGVRPVTLKLFPGAAEGEPGLILVDSDTTERGDAWGQLEARVTGPVVPLVLNAPYLIDALRALGTGQAELLAREGSPFVLLLPGGRNDWQYAMMLMKKQPSLRDVAIQQAHDRGEKG